MYSREKYSSFLSLSMQVFVVCCAHADKIKEYIASSKWSAQKQMKVLPLPPPTGPQPYSIQLYCLAMITAVYNKYSQIQC